MNNTIIWWIQKGECCKLYLLEVGSFWFFYALNQSYLSGISQFSADLFIFILQRNWYSISIWLTCLTPTYTVRDGMVLWFKYRVLIFCRHKLLKSLLKTCLKVVAMAIQSIRNPQMIGKHLVWSYKTLCWPCDVTTSYCASLQEKNGNQPRLICRNLNHANSANLGLYQPCSPLF